jgi:hypothetical protein
VDISYAKYQLVSTFYLRFCKSCPVYVRFSRNPFSQFKTLFAEKVAYDSDNRPLPIGGARLAGPRPSSFNIPQPPTPNGTRK